MKKYISSICWELSNPQVKKGVHLELEYVLKVINKNKVRENMSEISIAVFGVSGGLY